MGLLPTASGHSPYGLMANPLPSLAAPSSLHSAKAALAGPDFTDLAAVLFDERSVTTASRHAQPSPGCFSRMACTDCVTSSRSTAKSMSAKRFMYRQDLPKLCRPSFSSSPPHSLNPGMM